MFEHVDRTDAAARVRSRAHVLEVVRISSSRSKARRAALDYVDGRRSAAGRREAARRRGDETRRERTHVRRRPHDGQRARRGVIARANSPTPRLRGVGDVESISVRDRSRARGTSGPARARCLPDATRARGSRERRRASASSGARRRQVAADALSPTRAPADASTPRRASATAPPISRLACTLARPASSARFERHRRQRGFAQIEICDSIVAETRRARVLAVRRDDLYQRQEKSSWFAATLRRGSAGSAMAASRAS